MSNTSEPLHPREIKTYKLRRSRVTAGQAAAISEWGSEYLFPPVGEVLELPADIDSNAAGIVLEIGFGMGEATAAYAALQPELAVLAMDLHTPGVGRLISLLTEQNSKNVKIIEGDALEILRERISDSTLDGVRLFFPDPWPKKRHHKRRFVQLENLELVAAKTKLGGFFHFATDWPEYAEYAEEKLQLSPHWQLMEDASEIRWGNPAERPRTRFEQRGLDAERPIKDLVAVRIK